VTSVLERPPALAPPAPEVARRRPAGQTVLGGVLVALSLVAVVVYVAVAMLRIGHDHDLEWMEGGVVDHVQRVLDGDPLYGPPSLRFTPYLYTPLYYLVAAPVAWVTGNGYAPLRGVSIASSLVAFAAVGALVRRETGDRRAAIAAAGLFAACYRIGGAWFDLARVDSLFLALTFAGLLAARSATTARRAGVAALLLALAFLAKQQALVPALAAVPWLAALGRRQLIAYVTTLAGVIGATTLAAQAMTDGWYLTYVATLPRRHAIVDGVWTSFWTDDLLRCLGIAILIGGAGMWAARRSDAVVRFHLPVVGGLVATAYWSRLHSGGYDNVLLPAYGGIAVFFGLGVAWLSRSQRRILGTAGLCLCCLQLVVLAYDPRRQLPSEDTVAAGDRLLDDLRQLDGGVYFPGHGWYATRVGTSPSAHGAAVSDILRADLDGATDRLRDELEQAIREQRFAAVVVDDPAHFSYLPDGFERWYRLDRRLPGPLVHPVTGTRTAPATVWIPRAAASVRQSGTAPR
jgi:hypothetical protein